MILSTVSAINMFAGVRVKRGLSTGEQKKLVDALNADRRAVGENMGITFEKLTYNRGLEMKAENFRCDDPINPFEMVPLKVNRYFKEVYGPARFEGKDVFSRAFFNPKHTKIGCSKEKTCSYTTKAGKNAGKTREYWGFCILGPSNDYRFDDSNTPEKNGMPTYEKYGDLLGVGPYSTKEAEAKSGNPYADWVAEEATVDAKSSRTGSSFFSLTLFLVSILAFYF
ncbi:Protein CBG11762 [Caenorhabditis briggsae]|uniref:Protein CBG11762 n=1 Tax=Caenorhabditis briggsae TaxID=6238 RepID=A8XE14_CAEBR|nr:Protein CBG11762 [Caenorhabditis briggsae]CAP30820.2 Protein CBG11762 [Caenorhabditis briggsae]